MDQKVRVRNLETRLKKVEDFQSAVLTKNLYYKPERLSMLKYQESKRNMQIFVMMKREIRDFDENL